VVTLEVDGVLAEPGFGTEGVSHTNTQDPLYVAGVPGKSPLSVCLSVCHTNTQDPLYVAGVPVKSPLSVCLSVCLFRSLSTRIVPLRLQA